MLAKRFSTILPPMSLEEALETTKIHSVAGKVKDTKGLITQRPFRKPHHSISDVKKSIVEVVFIYCIFV